MMPTVAFDQVAQQPIRTRESPVNDAVESKELIQRLSALAEKSPASRAAIAAALREANLTSSGDSDGEAPLRKVLQVEDGESIDSSRVLEILSVLLDNVSDWDRVVWSTWKQIAPESRIRRPARLQQTLKSYVTADPSVSRNQVMRDLLTLKQLTSSLVSAMGVAGNTFATGLLKELSPQQIEEFIRGGEEKMPLLGDRFKTTCWNKYAQLAAAMEERAPDVINASVVGFVEKFLKNAAPADDAQQKGTETK